MSSKAMATVATATLLVGAIQVLADVVQTGIQSMSLKIQYEESEQGKCASGRAPCREPTSVTPTPNEESNDPYSRREDMPLPSIEPAFPSTGSRAANQNARSIEVPLPYSLSEPTSVAESEGPDFDTTGFNAREAVEASRPLQIADLVWAERPSEQQLARYYPRRALERGREGEVRLDCIAQFDGHLTCIVASETLPNWGFGEAALRASKRFRLAPALNNGRSTAGARLEVPIGFEIAAN